MSLTFRAWVARTTTEAHEPLVMHLEGQVKVSVSLACGMATGFDMSPFSFYLSSQHFSS